VAGFQKKLWSMNNSAYITFQDQGGRTWVVATIKEQQYTKSSADIYIHNPPVNYDHVTTNGMVPSIHVVGDIISKKFDFMMGNLKGNPQKIAQVAKKWMNVSAPSGSYILHIGTGVDVAFIAMCAFAIDELSTQQEYELLY